MAMQPILHIVSHTDMDGVTAAAVAWHAHYPENAPLRVSLSGYGEVDELMLETLRGNARLLVLDLFCQRRETVDEVDTLFPEGGEPLLFDHHKTTEERFGNRKWMVIDTSACAAKVYYDWILKRDIPTAPRRRLDSLADLVDIANDRDLWLGKREESRLWQALVTLCGPWSVFARLVANPSSTLTEEERDVAECFVVRQEERFSRAREKVIRSGDALVWVGADLLEYGDVSDFCGLLLDRSDDPPRLVAVANRKVSGDWAISMRSREGLAGRLVGLLRDGRKVRGGGHGDAAALYYPSSYKEGQIRDTLLSGIRTADDQDRPMGLSLGDLLQAKLGK